MEEPAYIIVVQCDIVKERCSGYLCELAFTERSGGFEHYPKDRKLRMLPLTCGGCCGRAFHRKIMNAVKQLKKQEGIEKEQIVVHLSSCVATDNYHGPPCPHKDYLKTMIQDKLGLALRETTRISKLAADRRERGFYRV